eukprot:624257-Pelagomonas_calceolata.AAC.4
MDAQACSMLAGTYFVYTGTGWSSPRVCNGMLWSQLVLRLQSRSFHGSLSNRWLRTLSGGRGSSGGSPQDSRGMPETMGPLAANAEEEKQDEVRHGVDRSLVSNMSQSFGEVCIARVFLHMRRSWAWILCSSEQS